MGIDNEYFIEALRLKFIHLLESKRGLQANLSKSIGKASSYFSEIKRGNPVNALHLKAIEIVLGPEKVIELLDIDNNWDPKRLEESQSLISQFKNLQKARQIIDDLLILETIDLDGFEEIHKIIKMKLEKNAIRTERKKRKKIS